MIYKFHLYQPRDAPSIHFIDYRLKNNFRKDFNHEKRKHL